MNTRDAERMAAELMIEFGLEQWTFRFDNSKRRFGVCRSGRREIGLSKPLTVLNTAAEVEDTLRHEIAHAIAPLGSNHGPAWKQACRITGARPERCYDSSQIVQPPAAYRVICPTCGVLGSRHRKPRGGSAYHPACGKTVTFVRVVA